MVQINPKSSVVEVKNKYFQKSQIQHKVWKTLENQGVSDTDLAIFDQDHEAVTLD